MFYVSFTRSPEKLLSADYIYLSVSEDLTRTCYMYIHATAAAVLLGCDTHGASAALLSW